MKLTGSRSKSSASSAAFPARLATVLAFMIATALSFYVSSSASSKPGEAANHDASDAATLAAMPISGLSSLVPLLVPQGPAGESISTFASNCSTGQTTYSLGQTVCAQVAGAVPGTRRLFWGDPTFHVVKVTFITTNPQNDSFVPATAGTWTLLLVSNDGIIRGRTNFIVRDAANPSAEVSVSTGPKSPTVTAGGQISFHIQINNIGPDAAAQTRLTIPVPTDTTFAAFSQDSGPSFICVNPPVGGTGSTVCDLASLAKDAIAEFTATYNVSSAAAVDSEIINDVSYTSNTADPVTKNNSASASAIVVAGAPCTVNDGSNVTVDNDIIAGNAQGGAVVNFTTPGTSGPCTQPVTCSSTSGSFFPIGETSVVCLTDDSTNVSRFSIIVNDTATPSIACPADLTVVESTPGSGTAEVTFPAPTVSDNDPNPKITFTPAQGSSFTVAGSPHTVTATVTDFSGHTASCSFTVSVTNAACALSCPSDISVAEDPAGSGTAVVNFGDPTESGTCGTVSYDHASGSAFPVGTTTVTATSSTTGASCQFHVIVTSAASDTEPPVISCPGNIVQAAIPGSCTANVAVGTATATDNKPGVTVSGQRSDGLSLSAAYPVGEVIITWTATDAAGNTADCQQSIQVTENVKPTVTAPAPASVIVDASCDQVQVPNFLANLVTSDNCTPRANLELTQSPAAETLVGVGSYPITITVTDASGNTSQVTTTFAVIDNTPPVITLNGAPSMTIECHTSFSDPGAVASDACDSDVPVTANNPVDVNTPGTYTITYSAQDDSGNHATNVTRTVNVVDTIAPVITLNGSATMVHECHTSFVDPGATAIDGCAGNLTSGIVVASTVNPNAVGVYTITYNVSDAAGNAATPVTRTVNVVDTTAPTITIGTPSTEMWPPNHRYQTFNVTNFVTSASDGCDSGVDRSRVVIQKVTSDEAENGQGDGNTLNDIVIAPDCKSVQLRAERDGNLNGRVYTITFKVSDAAGNSTTATAKVMVPKSQNGSAAIDDGPRYTVNGGCP